MITACIRKDILTNLRIGEVVKILKIPYLSEWMQELLQCDGAYIIKIQDVYLVNTKHLTRVRFNNSCIRDKEIEHQIGCA